MVPGNRLPHINGGERGLNGPISIGLLAFWTWMRPYSAMSWAVLLV